MPDGEEEIPSEEEVPEEEEERPSAAREAAEELKRRAVRKAAKPAKEVAKKGARAAGRAAKEGAKKAGQAVARLGAQALSKLGLAIASNPYVALVVGIIILIIGIIVIIFLVIWILWLMHGGAGKGTYIGAGPRDGANKAIYDQMEDLLNQGKIVIVGKDDLPQRLNEPELPKEKEFLLGKAHPQIGEIDIKLLKTLVYLGNKHERIGISHIIYPYIYMPIETIETKDTKDVKFLKSISAHKQGMAADIVEIDKVCKKCKCSTSCGRDKVPIKVVWQDDPIRMNPEDRGISRDTAVALIEESLGLTGGSLEGNNLEEVLENTGRAELERYLKLEPGSLDGNNLEQVIESLGRKELNEKLGLPPETDLEKLPGTYDNELEKLLLDAGQSKIEAVLNLPDRGFQGNNLRNIAINLGRVKVERELGLPEGSLADRNSLNTYINLKFEGNLDESLKKIARDLELPDETILVNIINKARAGQDYSEDLRNVGTKVLSQSLGFPGDVFAGIAASPNSSGFDIPYNQLIKDQFWQEITNIENQNGLPDGSLGKILDNLARGENPKDNLELISSEIIGNNLGLGAEVAYKIAKEGYSLNQALSDAEMTRADLAVRLGLSEETAALIFDPNAREALKNAAQETGQLIFGLETGLPYDLLGDFIDGNISYNTLISQAGVDLKQLSQSWGLPETALGNLISGNPKQAFESIGKDIFKKNFNISGNELDAALNFVKTGDFKQAAEQFIKNEVFAAIAASFGLPPMAIPLIINVIENPSSLISAGIAYALGGPLGGIVSGILGGIFGGSCNTACYRPKAREKVHQVTKELLQMPSADIPRLGLPDPINMRITQLIIWSYERDVLPFETGAETPTLDEVYGKRPLPNYGLFATTENNYLLNHIHIGF